MAIAGPWRERSRHGSEGVKLKLKGGAYSPYDLPMSASGSELLTTRYDHKIFTTRKKNKNKYGIVINKIHDM